VKAESRKKFEFFGGMLTPEAGRQHWAIRCKSAPRAVLPLAGFPLLSLAAATNFIIYVSNIISRLGHDPHRKVNFRLFFNFISIKMTLKEKYFFESIVYETGDDA